MPYFKTAQEWLDQSILLLEARPTTTRITTRYTIKPVKPRETDTTDPKPPRGSLVIKTYDPASGVTLKYRTTKAAEVSRLIQSSLGRLGRSMAAVPEPPVEETMTDAPADGETQTQTPPATTTQATGGGGGGGGGGKKKKKGRK